MVEVSVRVAVYGGDSRQRERWRGDEFVHFQSSKNGGNGELRRLEAALRAGNIGQVILLWKWNGHSGMAKVRALCRRLRVPVRSA